MVKGVKIPKRFRHGRTGVGHLGIRLDRLKFGLYYIIMKNMIICLKGVYHLKPLGLSCNIIDNPTEVLIKITMLNVYS